MVDGKWERGEGRVKRWRCRIDSRLVRWKESARGEENWSEKAPDTICPNDY
jgi:hypothetical protein